MTGRFILIKKLFIMAYIQGSPSASYSEVTPQRFGSFSESGEASIPYTKSLAVDEFG